MMWPVLYKCGITPILFSCGQDAHYSQANQRDRTRGDVTEQFGIRGLSPQGGECRKWSAGRPQRCAVYLADPRPSLPAGGSAAAAESSENVPSSLGLGG